MVPDVKTRLLLVLALMLPVANAAWAGQSAEEASQAGAPVTEPSRATGEDTPPVRLEPVQVSRQPSKPSGFWGSSRPAVGGAYRYRLLGIGVAVVLLTLGIMMWILRRPARGSSRPGAA